MVAVMWLVDSKGGDERFETEEGCAVSQLLKWAGKEAVCLRWDRR